MKRLILIFLSILSSTFVQSEVFLEHASLKDIQLAERALTDRHWVITAKSPTSVEAEIVSKGRSMTGKIKIYYEDGALLYSGTGLRKYKKRGIPLASGYKSVHSETNLPLKWIRHLQRNTLALRKEMQPQSISDETEVSVQK